MKSTERKHLLELLRARFEAHPQRHSTISWADVLMRLETAPQAIETLHRMEETGGEPDVIGRDSASQHILFCDCSAESPSGRRSLCYDRAAREGRKENKPLGSAVELAVEMGIELLTEEDYRALQQLGEFDLKTSSWITTPADIRSLGGALFGDRRYNRVFVYHNGAPSYFAARGFRGLLRI